MKNNLPLQIQKIATACLPLLVLLQFCSCECSNNSENCTPCEYAQRVNGHCTCIPLYSTECDHGTYDNFSCDCNCDPGWTGATCDSSLLTPDSIRYFNYDLYLDSATLLQADVYSNSPLIDFAMNISLFYLIGAYHPTISNFDYHVKIQIPNPVVDTFNFSAGGSEYINFYDASSSYPFQSFSGWLIIDSLDIPNFAKGRFEVSVYNSSNSTQRLLKNGTFRFD